MYSFIKAVCIARSIGSQWKEVDLSNIVVHDIFTTYTKIYLELSNPFLSENVFVDMDAIRTEFSSYNNTLTQLLIDLDNRTLPTVDALPSTEVKFVKYSDAIRSEYKIKLTIAGIELPDNYPDIEKNDLEITRPKYNTNLSLIHSHTLVSVNGYIHMTDTDGSKAYVINGGKTMRKSRINHLGMLSFLDIGQLTKIKLQAENITSQNEESPLKEKIYFSVEEDLNNKSYILVLGGYLVFPSENVFYRNGEQSFTLDINNIPYLERLYESSLYIDLSELQLTEDPLSPNNINVREAYSDAVIKRYLTMSNSFLVVVDIPHLTTNKIHLRHSSLPGMFTAYRDPVYPLLCNYGKIAEYWKTYEDDHWSVTVQDSFLRNYIISQQPVYDLENVSNNLTSSKPFYHSHGYLLEIAGYNI